MRVRTQIWFVGALWIAVVAAATSMAYRLGQGFTRESQPVTVALAVYETTAFVCPCAALGAAWAASRLRRSGVLARPRTRTLARISLGPITVAAMAASLGLHLTVITTLVTTKSMGWPGTLALVSGVAPIFASAGVGFGLGLWLHRALALPLAVLLPFVVTAFPPGLHPVWIRYLFAVGTQCCTIDMSPAPAVLYAIVVMAVGTTIGVLITVAASPAVQPTLGRGTRLRALLLGGLVWMLGTTGAAHLAMSAGDYPVVPRSEARECVAGRAVICVWPEHAARVADYDALAGLANDIRRAHGLAPIERFVEQIRPGPEPGFELGSKEALPDRVAAVADGLSADIGCAPDEASEAFRQSEVFLSRPLVRRWWRDELGAAAHVTASPVPTWTPTLERYYAALRARPATEQGAWVELVTQQLRTCTPVHVAYRP